MSALLNTEIAIRNTIAFGPSACPSNLFSGSVDNVIRGLKVHANTISCARLSALEASFARARDWIGHDAFNDLSRRFIDGGGGIAEPLAQIGRDFQGWLIVQGEDQTLIALARFEWLWLKAYHAAEAEAMTVGAFAGKGIADILNTRIARHPAAAMVTNEAELALALGLDQPHEASAILITRPEEAVKITPVPPLQATLFQATTMVVSIGEILEAASENAREDELLMALTDVINAGAFILWRDK